MRKGIFIFSAFILGLSSCVTSQDEPKSEFVNEIDVKTQIRNPELEIIFEAIDSLDKIHQERVSRNLQGFLVRASDVVGAVCGSRIGGLCGAAAGLWGGGPVGAAIGGFFGSISGSELGYATTSYYVNKAYDCAGYSMVWPSNMYDCNMSISEMFRRKFGNIIDDGPQSIASDSIYPGINLLTDLQSPGDDEPVFPIDTFSVGQCDSLGYYHNSIMGILSENHYLYESDGGVDANRVIDDVISEMRKHGFEIRADGIPAAARDSLVNLVVDLGVMAMDMIDSSVEDVLDAQCDYMRTEFSVSDEDLDIHKNFTGKIAVKCASLSEVAVHSYAADLNLRLLNADISDDLRLKLALLAQQAINSSLCWRESE